MILENFGNIINILQQRCWRTVCTAVTGTKAFAENFNWTNSYDLFYFFQKGSLLKEFSITPPLEQQEAQKGKTYS